MRGRSVRVAAVVVIGSVALLHAQPDRQEAPPWQAFMAAASPDRRQSQAALDAIAARWRDSYAALLVDVARFLPSPRGPRAAEEQLGLDIDQPDEERRSDPAAPRDDFPPVPRQRPGAEIRQRLTTFLERQTRQRFGDDLRAWRRWMWARTRRIPATRR